LVCCTKNKQGGFIYEINTRWNLLKGYVKLREEGRIEHENSFKP